MGIDEKEMLKRHDISVLQDAIECIRKEESNNFQLQYIWKKVLETAINRLPLILGN